jgi:two-component sensor histidine kinase
MTRHDAMDESDDQETNIFTNMTFFCDGKFTVSKRDITELIKNYGGRITTKPLHCTHYISTYEALEQLSDSIKEKLRSKDVYFVTEQFIHDSISRQSAQKERRYLISNKSSSKTVEETTDTQPKRTSRRKTREASMDGIEELLMLSTAVEHNVDTYTKGDMETWSVDDVIELLSDKLTIDEEDIIELKKWLIREKIDGVALPELTMEYLSESGLLFGTCVKLLKLIKNNIY